MVKLSLPLKDKYESKMEKQHNVQSVEQLKKTLKPIRNINAEHKRKLKKAEKLAIWITDHVGTMGFFFTIFTWTILWLGWNSLGPVSLRFDPLPAFVFWLFISNMIQIFLMPLIMIGQNLQSRHSELRAEANFEVNKKSEIEIEMILQHLENQNKIIQEILDRLENHEKK
jgi:uncharacterized membrane protein